MTRFLLWIGTYCISYVVQQTSGVKDLSSLVRYVDSCLAAIRHVQGSTDNTTTPKYTLPQRLIMHLSQIQRKYVFCHRPSPLNCVKSRRTKPIASWWVSVIWWTATFTVGQKNSWKGAISAAKNKTKLPRQILTSLESSSIEESEFNDVTWHKHVIILSTYIM